MKNGNCFDSILNQYSVFIANCLIQIDGCWDILYLTQYTQVSCKNFFFKPGHLSLALIFNNIDPLHDPFVTCKDDKKTVRQQWWDSLRLLKLALHCSFASVPNTESVTENICSLIHQLSLTLSLCNPSLLVIKMFPGKCLPDSPGGLYST